MSNELSPPLVSIGIPTYNRPDALQRALTLITGQTYQNLEIIVSDNHSNDPRVKAVAEDFAKRDSRIRFFRQPHNTGIIENTAFVQRQATGKYFAWMSDDDWRAPEFIELLVETLEREPSRCFAFCDYNEVLEDGAPAPGYPRSHYALFKSFECSSRLKRVRRYYWPDFVSGQGNLFYALFRKPFLDSLDLDALSENFRRLDTDCLIVFKALQHGSARIRDELMCTLTCANRKHYLDSPTKGPRKSILSRLREAVGSELSGARAFTRATDLYSEKLLIVCLMAGKAVLATLKIIRPGLKHRLSKLTGRKPSEASAALAAPSRKNRLNLPDVTLIAVATKDVEATVEALKHSAREIDFGDVKLVSHYTPFSLPKNFQFHRIRKLHSIDEWSYEIIYRLSEYVETDFALLVHADGFVVNPESWREEFMAYDYIGAPWPLPQDDFSYRDPSGNIVRVGNSVSLRSKRLIDLPRKLGLPWEPYHGYFNEDGFICVKNRLIYEREGMKFAPLEVAKYFSHETMLPEMEGIKPFAFHKWAGTNAQYPKY